MTKRFHLTLWLAILLGFGAASVCAQAPAATMQGYDRAPQPVWARHFGSTEDDGAYAVLALDEGGFVLAGDCIGTNGFRQMCLLRLGKHGELLFERRYPGSGTSSARAVRTTNDGGFVLSGSTRGPGGNGTDLYVVKVDPEGDVEWSRISQNRGGDFSEDILHARGGGFVSAGRNALDFTGGYNIVKMNKPGTVVWTRNFNGEQANAIAELSNGRIAAIGVTKTIPKSARPIRPEDNPKFPWVETKPRNEQPCTEEGAFLFTVLDWKGAIVMERTYWNSGYDVGNSLVTTTDKGFLMVGSAGGCPDEAFGYDAWIVRTDSTGDTLWTKKFGGVLEDHAYSVLMENDGGFVIGGSTRSWGQGESDALLFKIDSKGKVLWSTAIGGPGNDVCYEVQHTAGGYILSGTTTSYEEGDMDMYLVKVELPSKP